MSTAIPEGFQVPVMLHLPGAPVEILTAEALTMFAANVPTGQNGTRMLAKKEADKFEAVLEKDITCTPSVSYMPSVSGPPKAAPGESIVAGDLESTTP